MMMKFIHKKDITSRRYFDWVITTPIMLITTVLFMIYRNKENENSILNLKQLLQKHKKSLLKIVVFNFLMLLFGYLGEKDLLNKTVSTFLGFVFFALSFYEIWKNYAKQNKQNKTLFYIIFTIWSFYGIASVFPMLPKNIMYKICGHFHPKIVLNINGKKISKKCFIVTQHRIFMPSFGYYTGGLSVKNSVFKKYITNNCKYFIIGKKIIFEVKNH